MAETDTTTTLRRPKLGETIIYRVGAREVPRYAVIGEPRWPHGKREHVAVVTGIVDDRDLINLTVFWNTNGDPFGEAVSTRAGINHVDFAEVDAGAWRFPD